MGRVFVTQESHGKNLEPAKKLGTIHVILRANETYGECDYNRILERLQDALSDFDADTDFLLNLGEPHAQGLAYSLIMDKTKGQFRLLKWMRRTQEYVSSVIDVDW